MLSSDRTRKGCHQPAPKLLGQESHTKLPPRSYEASVQTPSNRVQISFLHLLASSLRPEALNAPNCALYHDLTDAYRLKRHVLRFVLIHQPNLSGPEPSLAPLLPTTTHNHNNLSFLLHYSTSSPPLLSLIHPTSSPSPSIHPSSVLYRCSVQLLSFSFASALRHELQFCRCNSPPPCIQHRQQYYPKHCDCLAADLQNAVD